MKYKNQYNILCDNELKLNYWAVTKAGSTTIKSALSFKYSNPNKNPHKKFGWIHNQENLNYIDKEEALNNGFYNFTMVRNPYERFKSMYKDFGLRRPQDWLGKDNPTIDDFLNVIEKNLYNPTCNVHLRSQISFISNEGNNFFVDKIFKLENIKEFFNTYNFVERIHNKTKDNNINLTQIQKEKIYNLYQKDFNLLNYIK